MRSLKRRSAVIVPIVLAAIIVMVAVGHPWAPPFKSHFGFPLPATATLLNSHKDASFETGYEFEFNVRDDALRDTIIKEWNLKPSAADNSVMSFAQLPIESWWPSRRLNNLPERYGRVDHQTSHYWSLWVDRENGKVYAEYGNW